MRKKSGAQLVFPIIVGAVSLLTILMNIQTGYISSFVVSFIGLAGLALFLLDKKQATILFYIWIVAQLVTYISADFVYYVNQSLNVSIGFTFNTSHATFSINFVPLFYFIGYRLLKVYDLIGKKIIIRPMKADSAVKSIDGEISEIVNRGKEGKWLKIDFYSDDKDDLQSVLVKIKGDERISRKKFSMAFVNHSHGEQKFIDWGKVKLK